LSSTVAAAWLLDVIVLIALIDKEHNHRTAQLIEILKTLQ